MLTPSIRPIEAVWRDLEKLTLHELYMLRARYTREQAMLGYIPLIASTVPLVFLIFGNHWTRYLPSHNSLWLLVMAFSIVAIVWALSYHFRRKGSTACRIYLIDLAISQKKRDLGRDSDESVG